MFIYFCLATLWSDTAATPQLHLSISDSRVRVRVRFSVGFFRHDSIEFLGRREENKQTNKQSIDSAVCATERPLHRSECRYGSLQQLRGATDHRGAFCSVDGQRRALQLLARVSN